eukprot:CAMPEP_0201569454 /NCGR_PEP_ID=MMETSP0190_2-20130828/11117_1 /ASSEMBLY_ACC=CAM_ASM_000263 /TAXON_ID=37353 /ORGANISM="Rosalina sp." /LENGTH=743 /DNA_ID=CAMNT_0047991755 /DNA_START=88 /DNA_END=2315 /DNA_ORIENTATION=+
MAAVAEEKVNIQLARLGGTKEPFEIDLYWTVNDLLDTISTKFEIPKETLKLLCKGKMLNDKIGTKTLKSLKIKKNDKIILMNKPQIKKSKPKPKPEEATTSNPSNPNNANGMNVDDAIERQKTIQEIKAAAEKLAQRDNDGYDWNAQYYFELEDQHGNKVKIPDEQRQALIVGMTLHEKGKKFKKEKKYKDAIFIMNLAFESFSKVDRQFLQCIDNYGLLALEIVWCYYLDQDEHNLSSAGKWLQIAEFGLEQAHGKNMERLKQIRSQTNVGAASGDFIPELALYVRLNILRGIQSFYNGDLNGAQTHLMKAEMDMRKLQISDLDLVKLESMGFTHKESRRALRFCNGNIDGAINHIYNKRDELERKRKAEIKRAADRRLQKKYGATKNGKFVDLTLLDQLQGMGVEKEIAIEALRQTDNAGEDTLNLCLDPERKGILASTLYSRFMNDEFIWKIEQVIDVLGGAGIVSESRVRAALFITFNDVEEAINMLSQPTPTEVIELDRVEVIFIPYVQKRQERIRREREMAEKMRKLQEEQAKKLLEQQKLEQEQQNEENPNDDNNDQEMNDDEQQVPEQGMNIDGNTDNEVNEDNQDNDGDDNMGDEEEANNTKPMAIDDGVDENDDDVKKDEDGNIVEPKQRKVKAMPNPNLGDVNENDEDEEDVVDKLVDTFNPIGYTQPNDDDMKIEQHILDDLDTINDEDEYLDLPLDAEKDALQNLKVLLTSMQMNGGNGNGDDNQQSFLS